jgi:putative oxidoreductase
MEEECLCMERVLGKFAPHLYAVLRIIAGLLFACHGAQKLFGLFGGVGGQSGATVPLFSLMGLAGVIEFGGGLLIALGILTSYAAFLASGEMAFAYFMRHFPRGFWPIQNDGELAVLYCFLFLYIAAHGAGVWRVWGRPATELTPLQQAARGAPL